MHVAECLRRNACGGMLAAECLLLKVLLSYELKRSKKPLGFQLCIIARGRHASYPLMPVTFLPKKFSGNTLLLTKLVLVVRTRHTTLNRHVIFLFSVAKKSSSLHPFSQTKNWGGMAPRLFETNHNTCRMYTEAKWRTKNDLSIYVQGACEYWIIWKRARETRESKKIISRRITYQLSSCNT